MARSSLPPQSLVAPEDQELNLGLDNVLVRAIPLGDAAARIDELNELHNSLAGVVVTHLAPPGAATMPVETAILQSMGVRSVASGLIRNRDDAVATLAKNLRALAIRHIFFSPADFLDERSLERLAFPKGLSIWLCFREDANCASFLTRTKAKSSSFNEVVGAISASRGLWSDQRPPNWRHSYRLDKWPKDPMSALASAMSKGASEYARFEWRWRTSIDGFQYDQLSTKQINFYDKRVARWIRTVCSDHEGNVCAGAYCGFWAYLMTMARPMHDPQVADSLPSIVGPSYESLDRIASFEAALVFGLVEAGFSLAEISALRVDQVRVEDTSIFLGGTPVVDALGDVLKAVYNLRWKDDRSLQLRHLVDAQASVRRGWVLPRGHGLISVYEMGREAALGKPYRNTQYLRELQRKFSGSLKSPVASSTKSLSDLVHQLPASFSSRPISKRQCEAIAGLTFHRGAAVDFSTYTELADLNYVVIRGTNVSLSEPVRHSVNIGGDAYRQDKPIDNLHRELIRHSYL